MDKKQAQLSPQLASQVLLQKISTQPNYCECAKIGARDLADGNMPLLRRFTSPFAFFERKNLAAQHEQIIFTASKDNIGLMGVKGQPQLFEENISDKVYHFKENECLDGSLVRKAIEFTGIPSAYRWLGYNCQAYADQIRESYQNIRDYFTSSNNSTLIADNNTFDEDKLFCESDGSK